MIGQGRQPPAVKREKAANGMSDYVPRGWTPPQG
jgi:hypothetical protein